MTRARKLIAIAIAVTLASFASLALAQHGEPHLLPLQPEEVTAPVEHGAKEQRAPGPINWANLSNKEQPPYLALVINAGIFFALFYTLGKKPVSEGLKQRRVDISKEIEDARRMLSEAKERAKKYQADLKNVEADAITAKAALVAAGEGEIERLLSEATERSERMRRDAERLVEQESKQLHQDLLLETIDLAVSEAQAALARAATPEDHARLAEELLAELSQKPAAPRAVPSVGGAS